MTRRISLVAVCWSKASASLRSRDSSCSVTRLSSFLSWLSSVPRGLFFFFEAPSRAMGILLTPSLADFQRPTLRRRRSSRMKVTPISYRNRDASVQLGPRQRQIDIIARYRILSAKNSIGGLVNENEFSIPCREADRSGAARLGGGDRSGGNGPRYHHP